MAKENVNIKLTVDTSKATRSVADVLDEMEQLNAQMDEAKTKGDSKMLQGLEIEFKQLEGEISNTSKTLGNYEDRLDFLKEKIKTVEIGTSEFKELQLEIKQVDGALKTTEESLEGMSFNDMGSMASQLAGGIGDVAGSMMLLGGASEETMAEMQESLNKAVGVVMGLTGAIDIAEVATKSWGKVQQTLNKVMSANPVLLIVAAVAALTAGVIALAKAVKRETQAELEANAAREGRIKASKMVAESTSEEIGLITALNSIVQDETQSEEARKTALEEMTEATNGAITATDLSKESMKELDKQVKNYTESIEKLALTEAYLTLYQEEMKKVAQAESDLIAAQDSNWKQFWAASKNFSIFRMFRDDDFVAGEKYKKQIDSSNAALDVFLEKYKELYDAQQEELKLRKEQEIAAKKEREELEKKEKAYKDYLEEWKKFKEELKDSESDLVEWEEDMYEKSLEELDKYIEKERAAMEQLVKNRNDFEKDTEQKLLDAEEKDYEDYWKKREALENNYAIKRQLTKEQEIELGILELENALEKELITQEEFERAKLELTREYREKEKEDEEQHQQELKDIKLMLISQLSTDMLTVFGRTAEQRFNEELNLATENYDRESEMINNLADQEIISNEEKERKLLELDKEREAKELEIRQKQFEYNKKLSLIEIAIQTAVAIMEAAPYVHLQIATGVLGASQAAVVATQQPPEYEFGGLINGNLHSSGGTLVNAEDGEVILNRKSMANPVFRQLASDINVAGGGVPIPTPAITGTSRSSLAASIDDRSVRTIVQDVVSGIMNIPVTVTENDITERQREVQVIQNKVTF